MISHDRFTEAAVAVADHDDPDWWRGVLDGQWPEPTEHQRRFRIRQLRLAAKLFHTGRLVEPGWIAAQLADLADLLDQVDQ